ncbi:hypothetical protein SAMN05660420_02857 [Desulfuromusa kysingii]|uniref:Uncharacterized protein n=1 Tax=Desulfuromusa kysingii TaxID=37625 RepID=A0A1H4D6V7_9BACT|nr:hypothetical protein [Desulfuromusa kysingii]SEA68190.1 hypothetical protein SAMN05660420_02857 [Desulfuromusa kysingii]
MHKMHFRANRRKNSKKIRSQRRIQRLINNDPNNLTRGSNVKISENFWYQRKKRAAQRVDQISKGRLILLSNNYLHDKVRYWMRDSHCQHVFKVSLAEIMIHGPEYICPYCSTPIDMLSFGSVEAIQEHVWNLSNNNIEFAKTNTLGSIHDAYIFYNHLHENHLIMSYEHFDELARKSIQIHQDDKIKKAI